MNVASLELCKKLYELSGWPRDGEFGYSLGLLLRELNATAYIELRTHGNQQNSWTCIYEAHKDEGETREIAHARTPEDAACLLSIKLFEEGVLKNEANSK